MLQIQVQGKARAEKACCIDTPGGGVGVWGREGWLQIQVHARQRLTRLVASTHAHAMNTCLCNEDMLVQELRASASAITFAVFTAEKNTLWCKKGIDEH